MAFVVYSIKNPTSLSIAKALLAAEDFEELERISGFRHFRWEKIDVLEIDGSIIEPDFLDSIIKTDLIVFVCSHSSSKGITSLTAHSEGNWSADAKLGGKPKQLAFASPMYMLAVIESMGRNNQTHLPVIYEATHHGPMLKTPSFFVEVGSDNKAAESDEYSAIVAKSVIDTLSGGDPADGKKECVIGIGGMHYAEKFTRIALEKGYAFSHIMSKYYVNEIDMLEQAVERSSVKADKAVIEWKSMKGADREKIIAELDRIGIDHERV